MAREKEECSQMATGIKMNPGRPHLGEMEGNTLPPGGSYPSLRSPTAQPPLPIPQILQGQAAGDAACRLPGPEPCSACGREGQTPPAESGQAEGSHDGGAAAARPSEFSKPRVCRASAFTERWQVLKFLSLCLLSLRPSQVTRLSDPKFPYLHSVSNKFLCIIWLF